MGSPSTPGVPSGILWRMEDATRRPGTARPNATDPGRSDETVVVATVADAAAILGITPGTVRRRLASGRLSGRKVDGQWRVVLSRDEAMRAAAFDPIAATGGADPASAQGEARHEPRPLVSAAAQAQLDAFRDALIRPHLERIEELAREVGRIGAERDAAIAERNRIAAQTAGDRVLVELAVAEADRRATVVDRGEAAPQGATRPATWQAMTVLVIQLAVIATLATYAGLTIDDLNGGTGADVLNLDRLRRAAAIGCAVGGLIGLLTRGATPIR